jgi:hypothetical protein
MPATDVTRWRQKSRVPERAAPSPRTLRIGVTMRRGALIANLP